jgi:uncharacterized protein
LIGTSVGSHAKKVAFVKILVKPTHKCNLTCVYCYDRQQDVESDMNLQTVNRVCEFAVNTSRNIIWVWHGGEPLAMPLEFYIESERILRKYGITQVTMQSNGTLLTEEHVRAFKKFGWRMSFSFDGVHNSQTRGRTSELLEKMALYREMHSQPGIVRVVTNDTVAGMSGDYNLFKSLGLKHVQYNRAFQAPGAELINADALDIYKEELMRLLTRWSQDSSPLSIRNFGEFSNYLMGRGEYLCFYNGKCPGEWVAVNPVGDLYPCDRWFPAEFKYGNVFEYRNFMEVIQRSHAYKRLQQLKAERLEGCSKCSIVAKCKGGCSATAILHSGGVDPEPIECEIRRWEVAVIIQKAIKGEIP